MGVNRKSLLVIGMFAIFISAYNQGLTWDAGYHGFFDNREYFNFDEGQTMFGSRIFGGAGFHIDDKNSVNAGINYLYEFGSKPVFITPDLIMYYSYNGFVNFKLGVFPRKGLVEQPLFLLTDTFNYYRPYVEGIFLEFRKPFLFHNVWIDWTGRQSSNRRESFIIGASGRIEKNIFFYEHHFSFYHYALPSNAKGWEHIQDNGGLIASVGTDLSRSTFFDTLLFSSGLAFSYDRLRSVYNTKIRLGWYSSFNGMYKGFGISGDLYWGDKHLLLNGDSFYRSGSYQRFNLYYLKEKSSKIRTKLQFSFHLTPGNLEYSQLVSVFIMLNGPRKLRNSDQHL